jgi:CO dehydrogenase maturation factor
MGTIIAVNGKGGTGKSTVTGLIVDYLAAKKLGTILAVDADPNSTLSDVLGIKIADTMVSVIDQTSKDKDNLPSGMTKDRFIEMKVQESIGEADDFDLLAMGRPEGPGCYC